MNTHSHTQGGIIFICPTRDVTQLTRILNKLLSLFVANVTIDTVMRILRTKRKKRVNKVAVQGVYIHCHQVSTLMSIK